jgi:hypothetical protein
MKWYEIDFNWYVILLLERLGLASHVNRAKLSARAPAGESHAPLLEAGQLQTSQELFSAPKHQSQ